MFFGKGILSIVFVWMTLILALFGEGNSSLANAQPQNKGAVETFNLSALEQKVPLDHRYLELWRDTSGSTDLAQVQSLPSTAWFLSETKIPSFKQSKETIWTRFTLSNPDKQARLVYLEFNFALINFLDLYGQTKDGIIHKQAGDMRPASLRDIDYRLPVFKLNLQPGESTFYLRVQTEGTTQVPLVLWEPDAFQDYRADESAFLFFFFGFIVVMALYNGFLAINTRDVGYVFYVAFIMTQILAHLGLQGHVGLLFPDRVAIFMSNNGLILAFGATAFMACYFALHFLNLNRSTPKLRILLLIVPWISFCSMLILFHDYTLAAKLSNLSGLAAALSIISASIYCCFRRYRPAYFFTLAWAMIILGTMAQALYLAGYAPLSNLTVWGNFIGAALEVVLLSLALGDKIRLNQQVSERAIRSLNENLEQKVDEKTRDIRSLLKNIRLGIFAIVGQSAQIDRDYSDFLEEILIQKDLFGRDAVDVLTKHANLNQEERSIMRSLLFAIVGEDSFAFEANVGSLPRELIFLHPKKGKLTLELDWNPMLGPGHIVEKILVVVKDVTYIREYQSQIETKKRDIGYIVELATQPVDRVANFFVLTKRMLEENNRLILSHVEPQLDALKTLFINMHTIKGMARSMGFRDLSGQAHAFEQILSDLQLNKITWNQTHVLEEAQKFQLMFEHYQKINRDSLNRSEDRGDLMHVSKMEFKEQVALIQAIEHADLKKDQSRLLHDLKLRIYRLIYQMSDEVFAEVCAGLPKLAQDLGKEAPNVEVRGAKIFFTSEGVEAIKTAFIHILRNTMDHGIEGPDERRAKGKVVRGSLSVHLEPTDQGLRIKVMDDGRGLSVKTIEAIAIVKGIIPRVHQLTAEEIVSSIFHPGFTTAKSVSDISGRGIGMGAVKQRFEQAGGNVRIELLSQHKSTSQDFVPFVLHLLLPTQYYLDAEVLQGKRSSEMVNEAA